MYYLLDLAIWKNELGRVLYLAEVLTEGYKIEKVSVKVSYIRILFWKLGVLSNWGGYGVVKKFKISAWFDKSSTAYTNCCFT